jgi:NAD(P)-dependent dehydrogenase (short-subunit alcohol dehydrogenase family)
MNRLKDKVAIITGAGRGIGREICLYLASEGAKIVVNDLGGGRDGSGEGKVADQVVDEIKALGGEAAANYDSVGTVEGGQNIFNTAIDSFGRADFLVNNAGVLRDRTLYNMEESDWDVIMEVHLKGHYNCTRPLVRYIKDNNVSGVELLICHLYQGYLVILVR